MGINSDLNYLIFVDRHGILGLGNDVPMTGAVNSDAIVALVPKTGQFVTIRLPYPMGYYSRSMQGRVDWDRPAGKAAPSGPATIRIHRGTWKAAKALRISGEGTGASRSACKVGFRSKARTATCHKLE